MRLCPPLIDAINRLRETEMLQRNPSNLPLNTKIAGAKTVRDWLRLRMKLVNAPGPDDWKEAYEFFKLRIGTRFLKPIGSILQIHELQGEGHAACALQCVLIEFLEAFFQGKIYSSPPNDHDLANRAKRFGISLETLKNNRHPTEYTSSREFFLSFLTSRMPFARNFNKGRAEAFYGHIRCGLLHEAATKGSSIVLASKSGASKCLVDATDKGIVIYRDAFQNALLDYLEDYHRELGQSELLQKNFIRKMDDIAQIERCFYFAYGRYLSTDQICSRVDYVHNKWRAKLNGWTFRYNKKSRDGTAKANIERSEGGSTWGACYEIDAYQFKRLVELEKGYNPIEVWAETDEGSGIIAKTFYSQSHTLAAPSPKYRRVVLQGAKQSHLPKDYITRFLAGGSS